MFNLIIQEKGYQLLRSVLGAANNFTSQDYEPVVKTGQWLLSQLNIPSLYTNYSRYLSSLNIKRSVFSLDFPSPITFAAFESHLDSIIFWLNLGCGGGCLKTIKHHPELGNKSPRIQKLTLNGQEHLINALGLPGKGVKQLLKDTQESSLMTSNRPIGFSLGGHSLEDYMSVFNAINNYKQPLFKQMYYEINISCPNTDTGKSLHDNLSELEQLITFMRANCNQVIIVKVSPDADNSNLCDIASLVKSIDSVTINAGNTQFKKTADVGLKNEAMSIGGGGLSGPLLFERTLEMAELLAQFNLPLISTGGISTAEQVAALRNHGVEVVGLATALVKNPFSIARLNHAIAKLV